MVDSGPATFKPFPVVQIADILNALGERLEKWKELGKNLFLIVKAMHLIATNTVLDSKYLDTFKVISIGSVTIFTEPH